MVTLWFFILLTCDNVSCTPTKFTYKTAEQCMVTRQAYVQTYIVGGYTRRGRYTYRVTPCAPMGVEI